MRDFNRTKSNLARIEQQERVPQPRLPEDRNPTTLSIDTSLPGPSSTPKEICIIARVPRGNAHALRGWHPSSAAIASLTRTAVIQCPFQYGVRIMWNALIMANLSSIGGALTSFREGVFVGMSSADEKGNQSPP